MVYLKILLLSLTFSPIYDDSNNKNFFT